VLDLEPRGVGLPEAQAATGSVVRGLRQLDVFQVLSSDDVRQLLALERTRQLSGAKAESSVGQLGAALNAPNAVVGSVTRVGGKLQVEIRLLDAPTQRVLSQKTLGPVSVEQVASQLPAAGRAPSTGPATPGSRSASTANCSRSCAAQWPLTRCASTPGRSS